MGPFNEAFFDDNEAFIASLSADRREEVTKLSDSISAYIRSLLFLKHTQLPTVELSRQIMPSYQLKTLARWEALGVPASELVFSTRNNGHDLYSWKFGPNLPLYLELEARLEREDFQRRLQQRQISRLEWLLYRRDQRRGLAGPGDQEKRTYEVLGELTRVILLVSEKARA